MVTKEKLMNQFINFLIILLISFLLVPIFLFGASTYSAYQTPLYWLALSMAFLFFILIAAIHITLDRVRHLEIITERTNRHDKIFDDIKLPSENEIDRTEDIDNE